MTSGLGAGEQSRPGSGGGGEGGGGSQSYDFRAALGRGSSSGWGGPEETLRGPVALSSASWPSPPPPHQRSDRVGEVAPPPHPGASANCAELGDRTPRGPPPAGPGTLGVAFSGLVLWAASASLTCRDDGPAPAGADLLHLLLCSYLAPALGPSSACRDFRFLMAPLLPSPSNTRFPRRPRSKPLPLDSLLLLCAKTLPPCLLKLSVWVELEIRKENESACGSPHPRRKGMECCGR